MIYGIQRARRISRDLRSAGDYTASAQGGYRIYNNRGSIDSKLLRRFEILPPRYRGLLLRRVRYYLFQLDRAENANVTTEITVVAVPPHVPAEIYLGGTVRPANSAAHPGLRRCALRVGPQVPLERLLDGTGVRAQRATVLLPFVSAQRKVQLVGITWLRFDETDPRNLACLSNSTLAWLI